MEIINAYDGPGFVDGADPRTRRKTSEQSIKESHRRLMGAMSRNGNMALNAADFEKTMHLPVGKGRLACDETGAFDAEAHRNSYNPNTAPQWPMHLHSTITEGEFISVRSEEEKNDKLSTRKWALKPLERIKRFTLTPEDQMQNLKGQIEAERARGLMLEKKLELGIFGGTNLETLPDGDSVAALQAAKIAELEKSNKELTDRFEALMSRLESKSDEEDAPKGKRR